MLNNDTGAQKSVVYSVSELNQMVACLLTDCLPALKVVGEVSNFACPRSGHWYFSLKDRQAQVRCVFFQGKRRSSSINLNDGDQIIVYARLRLYETRGEFQLVVETVEAAGDGVLRQQFEALKAKLVNEGLFDQTKKQSLPHLAQTVGIITSETGAAIRDILAVMRRRFPAIQVIIYPTLVQGEGAAQQIAHQIKVANERQECEVLIITRGGGSLEDLWPFNEEVVARAVAASTLPTISAVGHEIDITILDFVADIRAATPSAAAELISPDQSIWHQRLNQLNSRFEVTIQRILETYKQRILYLKRCLREPEQRLRNAWQYCDELDRRLQQALQQHFTKKKQTLLSLTRALEAISPLATLVRGYSLIKREPQGSVLQSAGQVKVGETVTAQLAKGSITCLVKKRKLS